MTSDRYRDPKPETPRIEELVYKVKTGDIKLPKFQRPFVWKRKDILKLWDSIYRGYPIGSILLWLTHEKLAAERKIGDLDIADRSDQYPNNYLLDGQQRLSSLCGALYWNGVDKSSMWNISFDVASEQFLYPKDEDRINYFPLNKLMTTRDFNKQCSRFEAHPDRQRFYDNAERLQTAVKDYKVAAVIIGDMRLDEVAPIFERINSSGRNLTMVDLMRAATWTGGFDLNDAISRVRFACEKKRFDGIKDEHVLRSIAAAADLGIHKEDIHKLRDKSAEERQRAADRCVAAHQLAVDFLTTELPLTSSSYLPYALQLTFLVEFFNRCPKPTAAQRKELMNWFWETSISRHYGTSNTGLITKDLAAIRDFAAGVTSTLALAKDLRIESLLHDTFALNKASSQAFALLLADKKPRSLLDGSRIDTAKALATANRLEYHHIFPRAALSRRGVEKGRADYHLNICMLNLVNNREISDTLPSVYFPEIAKSLGNELEAVLESNYITMEGFRAGLADDYDAFIRERGVALSTGISRLLGM